MRLLRVFLLVLSPIFFPMLSEAEGGWTTYPASRAITAVAVDENNVKWFGMWDGYILRFDGTTWTEFRAPGALNGNTIASIAPDGNGTVWFALSLGYMSAPTIPVSFDGSVWKQHTEPVRGDDGKSQYISGVAVDREHTVWFTTNSAAWSFNGSEWVMYAVQDTLARGEFISVAVDAKGTKWFGTNYGEVVSFDDSAWTVASLWEPKFMPILSIAEDRSGVLWFGTMFHGVRSFDGSVWKEYRREDGLAGDEVSSIAADGTHVVWFGTENGVSSFDGKTWRTLSVGDGLADNRVTAVAVDRDNVKWFGTEKGISRYRDTPVPVEERSVPVALSIGGIFPNPFNPSTNIGFTLPVAERVTLAVYDITGRKVRDLISGPLPAGTHTAVWDGRDADGRAVSSGVYTARLTAGRETVSRKMTLLR